MELRGPHSSIGPGTRIGDESWPVNLPSAFFAFSKALDDNFADLEGIAAHSARTQKRDARQPDVRSDFRPVGLAARDSDFIRFDKPSDYYGLRLFSRHLCFSLVHSTLAFEPSCGMLRSGR